LETETTLKQVELLNELIANKAPLGVLIDPNSETASIETMATPLAGEVRSAYGLCARGKTRRNSRLRSTPSTSNMRPAW